MLLKPLQLGQAETVLLRTSYLERMFTYHVRLASQQESPQIQNVHALLRFGTIRACNDRRFITHL
jgi:hypothetical protein